jgi:hypothetical protein
MSEVGVHLDQESDEYDARFFIARLCGVPGGAREDRGQSAVSLGGAVRADRGERQQLKRIFETIEHAFQIDLVREIADALRREFGPEIDVHPGPTGAEVGAVNRSFGMSTWIILETTGLPSGDLRSLTTWVLRRTAQDRLLESVATEAETRPCSNPNRPWAIRGSPTSCMPLARCSRMS